MSNFKSLVQTIEKNLKSHLLLNSFDETNKSIKFTCINAFQNYTNEFIEAIINECLKNISINKYLNFEIHTTVSFDVDCSKYYISYGILSLKENIDEKNFWSLCELKGLLTNF